MKIQSLNIKNNNNEDKQKIEEQAKPVSHTEIENQKYYNPQTNGTFPFNKSNIPNHIPPQGYMQFMEQQRPFIPHPIHYGYPPYIPQTFYPPYGVNYPYYHYRSRPYEYFGNGGWYQGFGYQNYSYPREKSFGSEPLIPSNNNVIKKIHIKTNNKSIHIHLYTMQII